MPQVQLLDFFLAMGLVRWLQKTEVNPEGFGIHVGVGKTIAQLKCFPAAAQ